MIKNTLLNIQGFFEVPLYQCRILPAYAFTTPRYTHPTTYFLFIC